MADANEFQRNEGWFQDRLGKVTASRIADVMTRTKSGYGAGRKNYMAQLISEILTQQPTETYINAAMQRGIDLEPQAGARYDLMTDNEIQLVGFIDHPEIAGAGASPDGLIGDDGLVEIKCPNTATHIEYLTTGKIDDKYIKQMMFQMACTGRQWCDFVSHDDRLPPGMQLFIQRVYREDPFIEEIETEVRKFINEMNGTITKLKEKYNG